MAEPLEACAAWRDDLAAWLVAQGSPEREALLLEHLAGCDRCRAEADRLLAVAAVALAVDPAALGEPGDAPAATEPREAEVVSGPPLELADRISRSLRRERRRHTLRRGALAAVGAAAAAVVVVVALSVGGGHDPAPVHGQRFAFTVAPDPARAHAVVGADGAGSLVQLTATGLDPATTYALWLTPPGGDYRDRVPAGTFRPAADGTVDVRLRCSLPPDQVGRVWATTPDRALALDTA